uniref:C2H2-type domain-containing protein n=1 Tax=Nothobranchius furzeri TaxID=105023 RepID=A0A8C6M8U9_NOTFU
MSKRKLGSRPQHLSPPLPPPPVYLPDEDLDLLTFGQCSQAFPLAHILAFIQHKQGGCGSQNQVTDAAATPPSPASRAGHHQVTNAKPGPGFIKLRRGAGTRDQSWVEEPDVSLKAELRKPALDEPLFFTCLQCEGVFSSAWTLLQHAQHTHSFCIYQEGEDDDMGGRGGGHKQSKPAGAILGLPL